MYSHTMKINTFAFPGVGIRTCIGNVCNSLTTILYYYILMEFFIPSWNLDEVLAYNHMWF